MLKNYTRVIRDGKSFLEWGIISSFVDKFPVEDLSVSGNVKKMRKNVLLIDK